MIKYDLKCATIKCKQHCCIHIQVQYEHANDHANTDSWSFLEIGRKTNVCKCDTSQAASLG